MDALYNAIKSKSLTRKLKIKIYKTIARPLITYGCETWSKANETLRCFEGKIYGPLQDSTSNQFRIRINAEIQELYKINDIVQGNKSQRLRLPGHVVRPELRWRDNIKA